LLVAPQRVEPDEPIPPDDAVDQIDVSARFAGLGRVDPEAASVRFWTGRQSLAGVSVC
jgi:hypothetical protein